MYNKTKNRLAYGFDCLSRLAYRNLRFGFFSPYFRFQITKHRKGQLTCISMYLHLYKPTTLVFLFDGLSRNFPHKDVHKRLKEIKSALKL